MIVALANMEMKMGNGGGAQCIIMKEKRRTILSFVLCM